MTFTKVELKKIPPKRDCKSDSAGVRTQDPLLKREMLYQLSYRIVLLCKMKRNSKTLL